MASLLHPSVTVRNVETKKVHNEKLLIYIQRMYLGYHILDFLMLVTNKITTPGHKVNKISDLFFATM